MRRLLISLCVVGLGLAACAPTATPAPAAPAVTAPTEAPAAPPTAVAPTQASAPTLAPSPVPPTQAAPTAAPVKEAFTPSDPNAFALAAGRPQLVEFYAVW